MDRIKQYTGEIAEDTETKTVSPYYGATNTTTIGISKTVLFNEKLCEFLTECGVEARYDGTYLWINGCPMTFYISRGYNYFLYRMPFSNDARTSTQNYNVFNNKAYNFKFRLVGNPTTAFFLLITGDTSTLAFNGEAVLSFYKAKNIFSGRNAIVMMNNSSSSMWGIDLDDEGTPVDINRTTSNNSTSYSDNYALKVDFDNNPNRIPLIECIIGPFKLLNCYMQFNYSSNVYPRSSSTSADAQAFLKMNGSTYFAPRTGPFIKCEE